MVVVRYDIDASSELLYSDYITPPENCSQLLSIDTVASECNQPMRKRQRRDDPRDAAPTVSVEVEDGHDISVVSMPAPLNSTRADAALCSPPSLSEISSITEEDTPVPSAAVHEVSNPTAARTNKNKV